MQPHWSDWVVIVGYVAFAVCGGFAVRSSLRRLEALRTAE